MFKRRPLNKDKDKPATPATSAPQTQAPRPPQAPRPQQNSRPQGQGNQQGQNQNQGQRRPHRGGGGRNPNQGPRQQGQGQGNQQGQNQNPNQQRQGQPQGQNQNQGGRGGQQNRNKNRNNRNNNRNRSRPQRPQPPPAYLQRDILLIANKDVPATINEVRMRFDPLSKKLPVHITLLFPEPAAKITSDLLKKTDLQALPSLKSLTFTSIEIFDEFYLWLMPDKESGERISAWHEAFAKQITEHTQEEKYIPHITLGYIPRKLEEEEALALAKNAISTPLTIDFETLLLEEFSEDQTSRSLDKIQITV